MVFSEHVHMINDHQYSLYFYTAENQQGLKFQANAKLRASLHKTQIKKHNTRTN